VYQRRSYQAGRSEYAATGSVGFRIDCAGSCSGNFRIVPPTALGQLTMDGRWLKDYLVAADCGLLVAAARMSDGQCQSAAQAAGIDIST
jgi:hypothetical protein